MKAPHPLRNGGISMSVREEAISAAIRSRLDNDKRVGDLPVYAYVINSDVYLIGRVRTLEERDIVEFLARGTPGVRRVNTDELEVEELMKQGKGFGLRRNSSQQPSAETT